MSNSCPVHSYLFQHTPGENYFANFLCQCSVSHQLVEQWANTNDLVYIQLQPNLPPPSYSIQSTITLPITATRTRWQCHICLESFHRRQERDRHELTHVPYFIHCPLPHCAWRGNRADVFKKHWQQEDHCSYHEYYGRTPERGHIETFDPWVILKQIINGAISLREGEDQAIVSVQVKAYELQKPRHTSQFGLALPRPSAVTFAISLHTYTHSVSLPLVARFSVHSPVTHHVATGADADRLNNRSSAAHSKAARPWLGLVLFFIPSTRHP
ncbi:hypothetical protein EDB92DRAFT_1817681 [Lactarius akahatsu]|uniref:C2H2-type domain-containing protein n=1 Tax=Lactarius akahatsu TaxID=416441 RepID=A0AAD4LDR4_9AGAM|nr:hypothetical protein EDB92DRAFT_1817681 [Lactarius akahatsu]